MDMVKSCAKRTGQKLDLTTSKPLPKELEPDNQGEAALMQALKFLAPDLPTPRSYVHPLGQYQFDGTHKWLLDAAWIPQRLGVEVQGGVHVMDAMRTRDCRKSNELTLEGWTILTFTDKMCSDEPDYVVETIRSAFERNR